MMVIVERAEALVPHNPKSESLRDSLNREFAKLLKFKLIHKPVTYCP